jgi:hypothetical protein
MAETNTTTSLKELSPDVRDKIDRSLKNALAKFEGETKVQVSIPKNLQDRIGQTLFLSINGVHIVLPVDGSKNEVPKSFKEHLDEYLANVTI